MKALIAVTSCLTLSKDLEFGHGMRPLGATPRGVRGGGFRQRSKHTREIWKGTDSVMKAGRVTLIPPRDRIRDSARLRVDLVAEKGEIVDHVEIAAEAVADDDQAMAFQLFAFNIEEAIRKPRYLERYPLSEGEHNYARVDLEMQEDFFEWTFRQRRGQERFDGLGDKAVTNWRMQR